MRILIARLHAFLFFSICLIPLAAQSSEENHDILETPRSCLQYAEFRQEKQLQGLPKPLVSRGRILLDCNRGTVWHTRTPIQETMVYTFGNKHWLVKADGEVQPIKNAAQKRIGDILARIVRGDREFLDKYFRRETTGDTTQLVPTQKRLKKYIDTIALNKTAQGFQVTVVRTDNQNMHIDLSAIRELAQLDKDSCRALLETDSGCAQLFPAGN